MSDINLSNLLISPHLETPYTRLTRSLLVFLLSLLVLSLCVIRCRPASSFAIMHAPTLGQILLTGALAATGAQSFGLAQGNAVAMRYAV